MEKYTLTIIDTKSHLWEVNLGRMGKRELILGREPECDIVIPDGIISKRHGIFRLQGHQLMYMDLDSTNGTFLGNAAQRVLLEKKNGFVEIYDQSVLRIGNPKRPDQMILLLYRVSADEEIWKHVPNTDQIRIGRDARNQIVLPHPGVSRIHGLIQREGRSYVLYDRNSTNGLMVNGQTVRHSVTLQDKDVIQILDFQLLFSTECIYYKAVTEGISVRVSNVNKFVGTGRHKKQILTNVNCEIKPNEFVAIIGGSGAGKTTLMTAISGFDPAFHGKVYCNDIDLVAQFSNLKNIIGFVPQQDIIYENLTLKRMLWYTARLKMPKDTKADEIWKRIRDVLDMVGLAEHQNTFIRKLSGGQKKRASIAVELLADPKLFFLDEPTSGLDPGTEKDLMITLSELAKNESKTIIMVTHTTANLHLCDQIIFMGPGGRLCFYGNVEEAKSFYQTDDLVNIYNTIAENPQYWAKRFAAYSDEQSEKEWGLRKTMWRGNTLKDESGQKKPLFRGIRREAALRQYCILSQRYAELLFNDRIRLLVLLAQPFLIALLLSLVADDDIFQVYESTKSMLFALSCSGIWIGLFDSIQEICKERVIVKREYMANLKLPGYVMSKFTMQALLGMIQAISLSLLFLHLVDGDKAGIFFSHFHFEITFTLWMTVMASIAIGFVISSIMKTGDKAMTLAPFVLIIQLLFSGILFDLKGAGEKISYGTVSRWSVEALGSISKLNRLDLRLQKEYPMMEHEAEAFFKATKLHLFQSWLVLLVMIILFTVVSIIALRRIARDSR